MYDNYRQPSFWVVVVGGTRARVNMHERKRHKEVINLLEYSRRGYLRPVQKDATELHLAAQLRYGFRASEGANESSVPRRIYPEGRHSVRLSFWCGVEGKMREREKDKIVLIHDNRGASCPDV